VAVGTSSGSAKLKSMVVVLNTIPSGKDPSMETFLSRKEHELAIKMNSFYKRLFDNRLTGKETSMEAFSTTTSETVSPFSEDASPVPRTGTPRGMIRRVAELASIATASITIDEKQRSTPSSITELPPTPVNSVPSIVETRPTTNDRYNPDFASLYTLLFNVYSAMVSWNDAELVNLYIGVLDLLSGKTGSSAHYIDRKAIYRVLALVNEKIAYDRLIGEGTDGGNALVSTAPVGKISVHKRVLSRLVTGFPLSFEQMEMISLYEDLLKSEPYIACRDFVYKDSLQRSLLEAVLLSIEIGTFGQEISGSIVVELLYSIHRKAIEDYFVQRPRKPIERMAQLQSVYKIATNIRSGMGSLYSGIWLNTGLSLNTREEELMDVLSSMNLGDRDLNNLFTPIEIAYAYMRGEFCESLASDRQALCESIVALLDRQLVCDIDGESIILSPFISRKMAANLMRLNKRIVNAFFNPPVFSARELNDILTRTNALIDGICRKIAENYGDDSSRSPFDWNSEIDLAASFMAQLRICLYS
jgi:hypothetical protein